VPEKYVGFSSLSMFTDTTGDCIARIAFTFGLRSPIQRVQQTQSRPSGFSGSGDDWVALLNF
jgi:hypothetical protein